MASHEWSQDTSLDGLSLTGEEFNFFQLARLIENATTPREKPVALRFSGNNTRALKPNFVERVRVDPGSENFAVEVKTNGFHLTGQQGPVPNTFSEQLAEEYSLGNRGASDFLDIFNDRILRTLYEVKKRFDPMLFNGEQEESRLFSLFESTSGVLADSVLEKKIPAGLKKAWRQYAYIMGNRRISYSLLKPILSDVSSAKVSIDPFIGGWYQLPSGNQAKLDGSTSMADMGCLGRRYWSHDNAIAITLRFEDLDAYLSYLPGEPNHTPLIVLVAFLSDLSFDVDLGLELCASVVPSVDLGGSFRLGHSSWINSAGVEEPKHEFFHTYLSRQNMLSALEMGT